MVSSRWLPLLFVALLALPGLGLKVEGGAGIVLGPDGAFRVVAPDNWTFDNEECRSWGMAAVIFPTGTSWKVHDAPVISCNLYGKSGRTFDQFVAEFETPDRPVPDLIQQDLVLNTGDNRKAKVRAYGRKSIGFTERVAYIDAPGLFCMLRLEAPDQTTYETSAPAFDQIIESFEYIGPEEGEYLASTAARTLLLHTAQFPTKLAFTPPVGWKHEESEPGQRIYSSAKDNNYGVIAVYDETASDGDPQVDYESAWKRLVQTGFRAGPAPIPQSRLQDGWQVRTGTAPLGDGWKGSTVMLTVFTGFGKTATILSSYNDNSFIAEVEAVVKGVYLPGSLAGWWSDGDQGSRQFVDGKAVELGEFAHSARCYTFGATTYTFEGEVRVSDDRFLLLNENGTFSASGNKLTLRGQGGTRREVDINGKLLSSGSLPAWTRTYNFRFMSIPEAVHGLHLVLEGVEENDLDGCYDFADKSFVYAMGYHPAALFQPGH